MIGDVVHETIFLFVVAIAIFVSSFAVYASAKEPKDLLISRSIEYLDNGDYVVTEVYKPIAQPLSGTSGYKSSTYTASSGTRVFVVTVYGTFNYNGSTSSATSASASVDIYNANASFVSKNAYTSGASAYATGTVKYGGINISRTVSLTCDKNGNLY